MKDTLLLNADHTPLGVLAWQRAVWLVLRERVHVVDAYPDRRIRSSSLDLPWPAVVALGQYAPSDPVAVALSRVSVLARDGFTCQYCGTCLRARAAKGASDRATVDHVVPRSRARDGRVRTDDGRVVPTTSWENLVAACRPCNHRKGSRTPHEADMPLARVPKRPGMREAIRIAFARVEIEEAWRPFLPEGTGVLHTVAA